MKARDKHGRPFRRPRRVPPNIQHTLDELRRDPDKVGRAAKRELTRITGIRHFHVCVVAGSGWDRAITKFGTKIFEIEATRLPGFISTGIQGHAGKICGYRIGTLMVLVFRGRKHLYEFAEGQGMEACMHYVRVAHFAGCKVFVHTNAVGGINHMLQVGQAVIIRNHNKMIGNTPTSLRGKKFLDCSRPYNELLRKLCRLIDPTLVQGVIAQVSGPEFETAEEAEYLRRNLIDVVSMTMIPENLLCNHYRMWFLGISIVTDPAGEKVQHTEVLRVVRRRAPVLGTFMYKLIQRLPQQKTRRVIRRKTA